MKTLDLLTDLTDNVETLILRYLQEGIPIVSRPFHEIARVVGIEVENLMETVRELKEKRIIRQISPIYDTRMLGYESLLVAFKTDPANIETVAELINTHPGVSHNYEREHVFNLWFTLAVPPDSRLGPEGTVRVLHEACGVAEYLVFRAKRVFKIGLRLDPEGSGLEREGIEMVGLSPLSLTGEEKEIIRVTQEDMPVVERPFALYAQKLGIDEEDLLRKLEEFREKRIMRRFAAVLYHRNAGFSANAMVVWKVPEERIEEAGSKIASFRAVSHCYERTSTGPWHYSLFSMIHAKERDKVREVVEEIQKETGIEDYMILYSNREFKKRRVRYFEKDLYEWEERFNGGAGSHL